MGRRRGGYEPNRTGFRQIGQSTDLGDAVLGAAKVLAGDANAVGRSEYEAVAAEVTVGRASERRKGAVVREKVHDYLDSRDAILVRATQARGRRTPL